MSRSVGNLKVSYIVLVILVPLAIYEFYQEQFLPDRQQYREFIKRNQIVLSNFGNLHSISFRQHGYDGETWYVRYLISGSKEDGTVTIDYDDKNGSITKAYLVKNMGTKRVDIYP